MKFIGYKQVRISSIKMEVADIRRRSKAAHVADLAANVRELGEELIHAPLVRRAGKELLCGRDRMAALVLLKAKKVWVHLVDCDDREAEELEIAENAYRRQEDRTALIAKIAALRQVYHMSTRPDASSQEVQALANADAARITGVSVQRVKNAKASVAHADDQEDSPVADAGDAGGEGSQLLTLDLLGCNDASVEAVAKFARQDQDAIDAADQFLRNAQAAIRRMRTSTVSQELHAQVHRVASLVRSHRPEFVCPWCKGLPKSTYLTAAGIACAVCTAGYVSHDQAGRAPAELRNADAPVVAINGKLYPYADVRDGKLPPKNGAAAKPKKTVRVEDEQGSDITPLDADEAY